MIEVLLLSLALSMDAFAVSIGLGASHRHNRRAVALKAALYFGFFQGLMPLIGYIGGKSLLGWVQGVAHWIAFVLLVLVAAKMLFEAFYGGGDENLADDSSPVGQSITHRLFLGLAIATSIDAMAAGFSLTLLAFDPILACVLIGVITLVMSALGVFIGAKSGTWLEQKAEVLGGIILLLIAFKLLFMG